MSFLRAAVATLFVAAVSACSDVPPSTAPSQEAAVPTPDFDLVGGGGTAAPLRSRPFPDMCVTVPGSTYTNGKLLETWLCNLAANQQFIWKSTGEIVSSTSQAMCISSSGAYGRAGDPIVLWTCHGGLNQRWIATTAGEIKGINGRCIGLISAVRANGTRLTLQTCNGSTSQKWDNVTPPPPPPPSTGTAAPLRSRPFPDMCTTVPGSAYTNGKQLETWLCNLAANQQFIWKSNSEIVPSSSQGMCISSYGSQGKDGDAIVLWTCHGGLNQRWSATTAGEIKGINGKCIGLISAVRANGTRLTLQTCNGSTSQKWDHAAGTPPPPPPPSVGIAVLPGQSIQAAVNARPAGTTFIIKAGTHLRQTVIPKDGDSFIGEPGTVMDGGLVTAHAFRRISGTPLPSNVRIQGIKITRYTPARQEGAIFAGWDVPQTSTGWIVADCEISFNPGGAGIRTGHRMQILRNNIHHNGQIGILGLGDNMLIEGNEIAYNNTGGFSGGNEAGGTKLAQTKDLIVRNNFSHHNQGPGLWTDYDNIRTLYEGNRVEDNQTAGIFHEISQSAVIRNNVVRRNGFGWYQWMYSAGIQISASRDVEIYGNTVEENARGIVGIMQKRGSSPVYGPFSLENMYVHDNNVKMTVVATTSSGHQNITGIGVDFVDLTYYTSRGNRFVNNHYILGTAARYFEWMNGRKTEADWRAYGNDVTGTFTR